ncbi:hypothetical protein LXA43DRAFT_1100654 [Ganoderma leucocontextum]|nr:hypothetical protein LXA43DRAFT_1100654 [Ganoderma leucocontextum]
MSAILSLLSFLLGRKSNTGLPSESDPPQVPHPLTPPMSNLGPGGSSSPSLLLTPVNERRAHVEVILSIFDDPRYAHLDLPDWVRRVTPNGAVRHGFTARKFIRVMRDTASNLSLVDGERYVLDAVCACADNDSDMSSAGLGLKHSPEKEQEALARRLQRLASTWIAFLLWPLYAYEDHGVSITRTQQQYGMTLAERRLHDEASVLRREGHRCFLSGGWDRSYWRAFAMPDSDVDGSDQQRKSAIVTLEMVRRYGQLSDKYLWDADLMDRPESAVALSFHYASQLQSFAFALVPTGVAQHEERMEEVSKRLCMFNDLDCEAQVLQPLDVSCTICNPKLSDASDTERDVQAVYPSEYMDFSFLDEVDDYPAIHPRPHLLSPPVPMSPPQASPREAFMDDGK